MGIQFGIGEFYTDMWKHFSFGYNGVTGIFYVKIHNCFCMHKKAKIKK
jgi:hypothetical protein